MTRWARLTWQVPDPGPFAVALAHRLGIETRAEGLASGARVIDLGTAWLELRPWVRESPSDDPLPGGRLMLEPVPTGEPAPEDADHGAVRPVRLAGIGWSTVELDRAEDELGMWLGDPTAGPAGPAPDTTDPHLGAFARVRSAGSLPGEAFVLLQPSTEGRLAASLARDGEGPCALYVRPAGGLTEWSAAARQRGVRLGARRAGPLGTQALLLGGPVAGPHLLVVDAPRPSKRNPPAGTIAP
ncbi:MAG TPA: hypothetical protein VGK16_15195 [Candidatus Limnocylindrales bacterium]|jgi:hypothetical protein